jgi:hypothetical protein
MIYGRVDDVDGHCVATRFVAGVIPTDSVYITPTSAARSSVTAAGPLKLKLDWRSVGLGWARVWLPILALAQLVVIVAVAHAVPAFTVVMSVAMLLGAGLAYRAGKLPESTKARLRLLGSVTGFRVDPSRLSDQLRNAKRDSLGDLMDKGGIPMTAEGILSVIDDIPLPAMPLVYGFCCYVSDDPEWRECAEIIYQRHEAAEV